MLQGNKVELVPMCMLNLHSSVCSTDQHAGKWN
jgi:hypothetical protein